MELEMRNIQDILAQNLSGGQKRKLTFGIALLGDPQVSQRRLIDKFKNQFGNDLLFHKGTVMEVLW